MATITLSADTLISTLMPSGGGSLASGDTIQLAGHSLIVDADAVDYPVTIANSGADVNLELRDLGRIKLNATLPKTVHPWIDPANPLPVSAEPGIDGDPYRTNLTANARAEVQFFGTLSAGGNGATLPTATRAGKLYTTVSAVNGNAITLSDDIPIHVGDRVMNLSLTLSDGEAPQVVTSYLDKVVTLKNVVGNWAAGNFVCVVGGGVVFNFLHNGTAGNINSEVIAFTSPVSGGTIHVLGNRNSGSGNSRVIVTDSFFVADCASNFASNPNVLHFCFARNAYFVQVGQVFSHRIFDADFYSVSNLGTIHVNGGLFRKGGNCEYLYIGEDAKVLDSPLSFRGTVEVQDAGIASPGSLSPASSFRVQNPPSWTENSGTVTGQSDGSWYHAPATADDVTWRYADCTVPAGATLRLRCAWLREGSAATRASVAVTDHTTWWPQLWPLGENALASVEFTGGVADWRQQLLPWRNTGTEAATVRVWECVTGTVAGGYLRVEEVKGGQL